MTETVAVQATGEETVTVTVDDPAAIAVTALAGPAITLDIAAAQPIVLHDDDTPGLDVTVGSPPQITVTVAETAPLVVTVPTTTTPGPPVPGGGGGSYRHVQTTASATWTISHPLGYRPAVTVENAAGVLVEGDVSFPDVDTVVIHFSNPVAGAANLS